MMLWTRKEFAGHTKCFSIENENYGCDDCTWLKWWSVIYVIDLNTYLIIGIPPLSGEYYLKIRKNVNNNKKKLLDMLGS